MNSTESPLIYVVDDDHDDFFFLHRVLTKKYPDLNLKHFDKPKTFCDRLPELELPSLIILDINMPLMNGFEVMRFFNANDQWRELPVVFLSTADDMTYKEKALELGAVNYLVKPVNPFDWEKVIEQIVHELPT